MSEVAVTYQNSDVLNVWHLVPFVEALSDEEILNLRANSSQPGEINAERVEEVFQQQFSHPKQIRQSEHQAQSSKKDEI